MTSINSVVLVGRLTKDIELKYTNQGHAIGNMSIAVSESQKVNGNWQEKTNFFDVTLYGKNAENLKAYLLKGKLIAISGHLQQQTWQKDGQSRSKVVVIAEQVQLCSSNQQQGQQNTQPQQYAQPQQYQQQEMFRDDVPF